jgi:hypothetical protein
MLLMFQRFQVELSIEEDILSCAQYEKETLSNFYQRFLKLKAQALKVSDNQFITQAIKALHVRPLHSNLVRERLKTVAELYENFTKFSESKVLHFYKLEQQRKAPKHDEASRPACYNDNRQHKYPNHVNNIDSDGRRPAEIGKRILPPPLQERRKRTFDGRANQYNQRAMTM